MIRPAAVGRRLRSTAGLMLCLMCYLTATAAAYAAEGTLPIPTITFGVTAAEGPDQIALALEIIALLTILSLAPAIVILMTCFTRLIIVFHFLRQAIGTQQTPPNQVIAGLALFMTFFIMTPVGQAIYKDALAPYLDKKISYQEAFVEAQKPIRKFMLINTREKDLALFLKASTLKGPLTKEDVPLLILIPAFVISELKTAFIIGFILFIPFLIIDMVTASVLLAMGMMMLPPVMISMPFKLMLFILVDGWNLLVGTMIKSFGAI